MTLQDLGANFRESEKEDKAHVSGDASMKLFANIFIITNFSLIRLGWVKRYLIMFHQGGHSNQWYFVLSCPKENRFKGSSPSPFSMNKTVPPVCLCLSNMQPHLFLETFPSIEWTGILSIQISQNQTMKLAKLKKHMFFQPNSNNCTNLKIKGSHFPSKKATFSSKPSCPARCRAGTFAIQA